MMVGTVRDLQGIVPVTYKLSDQPDVTIEYVLDTGFEGALTLPANQISLLRLPFVQEMSANLADGTSIQINVHLGTIVWDDRILNVAVLAMGNRPLLGTALLNGRRVTVDFVEDGAVTTHLL